MHDYFNEINIPSVQIPENLFNWFETNVGNNRIDSDVTSGRLRWNTIFLFKMNKHGHLW